LFLHTRYPFALFAGQLIFGLAFTGIPDNLQPEYMLALQYTNNFENSFIGRLAAFTSSSIGSILLVTFSLSRLHTETFPS